jgi:hypothetical protein
MPWFQLKKAKKPELASGPIIKTITIEVTHEYNRSIGKTTETEGHLTDPAPQVYRPVRSASLEPLAARNKDPSQNQQGHLRSAIVKIPSGTSAEVQDRLEQLSTFESKARRAVGRGGRVLDSAFFKVSKRPSIPSVIIETEEVCLPSLRCGSWAKT